MGFCGNGVGPQIFREAGAGPGSAAVKAARKMHDSMLCDPINDGEEQANDKAV